MGRNRRFDEQDVLRSATEVFWQAGFAATSVEDVMQATGLGKGSLYGAFGDKRTLFHRVFDGYCAHVTAAFSHRLTAANLSAADRLRAMFDTVIASTAGPHGPPRACLLTKATAELAATDPDIAALARQTFTAMAEILRVEVAQAQTAGDVPPHLDARQTANHLLVVFRGIEALAEAGTETAVLRDAADMALAQAGLA